MSGPTSVEVDGLRCLRDLGGRPRRAGGVTPYGVFFRSESVSRVTDAGWRQLFDLGIRTVVDLRRPDEVATDRTPRPGWLSTVPVDLDGFENQAFWAEFLESGRFGTALYYLPHLQAMPERATAALSAIVMADPGGVLFHCMGGRDRTGLVAMLLLTAAGVTIDAMVEDYMETVRTVGSLGPGRPGSGELSLEEICARYQTTTEGAFRSAAAGLDLEGLLHAGSMSAGARAALHSWRGTIQLA